MNLKKLHYLIYLLIFTSCNVESDVDELAVKQDLKNSCVYGFNNLFMDIFDNDSTYEVKEVNIIQPNLIPGFYTEEEIEAFCFFELLNDNSTFLVAIDTIHTDTQHELYFCIDFKQYNTIDQSSNVHGNFDFLNNCDIRLNSNLSQSNWTNNIFDKRMINVWAVDSTEGNTSHKYIEITKKNIILDELDTINYYQSAFEIFRSSDSLLIFERQAVSENKLILKQLDNKEGIIYYLSKNKPNNIYSN